MKKPKPVAPPCLHCGPGKVGLVDGRAIYPTRLDLAEMPYWRCLCGAYVGCHKPGTKPLGYPANHATRWARQEVHAAFDPLWRARAERDAIPYNEARRLGYQWLASELGMTSKDCHISMMDEPTARRVADIIHKRSKRHDPA